MTFLIPKFSIGNPSLLPPLSLRQVLTLFSG
jgi:hypothetical protein